jgi:hypothetical protein
MSGKHLCRLTEISGLLWALAKSGNEQSERLAKYLDQHIAAMDRRERKKRARFVYRPNAKTSGPTADTASTPGVGGSAASPC